MTGIKRMNGWHNCHTEQPKQTGYYLTMMYNEEIGYYGENVLEYVIKGSVSGWNINSITGSKDYQMFPAIWAEIKKPLFREEK